LFSKIFYKRRLMIFLFFLVIFKSLILILNIIHYCVCYTLIYNFLQFPDFLHTCAVKFILLVLCIFSFECSTVYVDQVYLFGGEIFGSWSNWMFWLAGGKVPSCLPCLRAMDIKKISSCTHLRTVGKRGTYFLFIERDMLM